MKRATKNTGRVFKMVFDRRVSLEDATKSLPEVNRGEIYFGQVPRYLREVYARIEQAKKDEEAQKRSCYSGGLAEMISDRGDSSDCATCELYENVITIGKAYFQTELRNELGLDRKHPDLVVRSGWNAYTEVAKKEERMKIPGLPDDIFKLLDKFSDLDSLHGDSLMRGFPFSLFEDRDGSRPSKHS